MIQFIAEAQGLWYEGSESWLRRIQGNPMILPLSVAEGAPGQELLFHEDYFNSATRIRRGRVFQRDLRNGWDANCVARFPNRELSNPANVFNVNRAYKTADTQIPPGTEIELGEKGSGSRWIVVLSERIGLEGHFLTLKSKTLFGVLPELILEGIPESNRHDVVSSLNVVVEAASVQASQSVIDACRNAASHVISAMYPASIQSGKNDLGKLVKYLGTEKKDALADAGDLINKLHSRAKANAAASHGTRPVSRLDAELAISALAFLLQDAGWAVNE
ncbi:hypothetical protein IHE49_10235 [Rhodanobacter sp. 7MK24]|uniref:hypothetical protein n=1 Tax=Rhodanobacter sp. 7MK24 TaxID=2775922 RepID=UPI0017848207|nr:hypothetical protein [Rhodanobacter sp. 7MK24]MBD8880866.1 hypothetical protein [Rhodanobacter sp. 7MK24]